MVLANQYKRAASAQYKRTHAADISLSPATAAAVERIEAQSLGDNHHRYNEPALSEDELQQQLEQEREEADFQLKIRELQQQKNFHSLVSSSEENENHEDVDFELKARLKSNFSRGKVEICANSDSRKQNSPESGEEAKRMQAARTMKANLQLRNFRSSAEKKAEPDSELPVDDFLDSL